MNFQYQAIKHDPENGQWGDCHRACIASLLDLPLEEVPHFFDKGSDGLKERNEFLNARGLREVNMIFAGDTPLSAIRECMDHINPGLHYIMGGTSSNGTGHSVIWGPGGLVHDPSPGRTGTVGPMSDGYYWLTFLGANV